MGNQIEKKSNWKIIKLKEKWNWTRRTEIVERIRRKKKSKWRRNQTEKIRLKKNQPEREIRLRKKSDWKKKTYERIRMTKISDLKKMRFKKMLDLRNNQTYEKLKLKNKNGNET